MKNYLLKAICLLALAATTLPIVANDYLKIYFKDGHTERHYMKLVESISATKYDLDGVLHSDYQMQQIVMKDITYSYYLADIDSMSFTKVDEEQVKKDVETVTSSVTPIFEKCSNAEEMENHINEIRNIEGVEDIRRSGTDIIVKIRNWHKMVFMYPIEPENETRALARMTKLINVKDIKRHTQQQKEDGTPIKVAIAFQMINDIRYDERESYLRYLKEEFESMGYDAVFIPSKKGGSLDLDFYRRRLFEYDYVVLETHGGYDEKDGKHCFLTGEDDINSIETDIDDVYIGHCKTGFFSSGNFIGVTEDYIANSNSEFGEGTHIFFNGACSSLGGNDELIRANDSKKIKGNKSVADIFIKKGADIYMGYDKSCQNSAFAAFDYFYALLHGLSHERAFNELDNEYKNESIFGIFGGASLIDLFKSDSSNSCFLVNTHTLTKKDQEIFEEYNNKKQLELIGSTTNIEIDDGGLRYGFRIATEPNIDEYTKGKDILSNNVHYTGEDYKEVSFSAVFKPEPEITYYYRAFTFDDIYFNWGEERFFTIPKPEEPSSDDVNLVKNGDMEGTDVSNFFVKINAGDINPAVISNGVGVNGSRGIKVAATARVSETWDNQFWVRLNRPVSAGTKYRFSFNYRADKSADVSTEYHAEPSEYIDWGEYITFTSAWKSYSKEGVITSSQSKTDMPFQSIAFTLNNYADANNYYFDNIKFEILTEEEEPPVDLKLSSTAPISLKVGEGATLEILSGNGGYNAKSDKENVATAAIKHETTVVIVATGPGEATITVSDKSGKTKKISVTVKDSSASGWINLVNNSDMEGSDVSSFYERTGTWEIDPYLATISNGVGINGSRGIKVEATQKVDEIWDNQFWVRLNQPISEGTKYRFSFNYRADKNAEVREEFHAEPSEYLDWISDYINFTTNWKTFSQEGVVESNQSKDDMPFQSIAFDLNVFEGANNYYFDNFRFEVILDGQCPKPTFKLNGNKLSIQSPFTTRIYYTLDGTTPTTRSSVYTSPLALNQSCIVKAIAVVDASNISPVAAYTYSGEVEEEVDERIEDVIPSEYRDKIEQYIPIYDGINPPNVEGAFYISPNILAGSSQSKDKIGKKYNSQYLQLKKQDMKNNTISMIMVSESETEWKKGDGAFISGSGDNFTIFFDTNGVSDGITFVEAYFISGTKTADGIKNLRSGFLMKEKGSDPNGKLVPVGTYRFFKDDDGLSINVEWPYGNKYGARKRSAKNKLLPDMHDVK